jgi:hypothetical protein
LDVFEKQVEAPSFKPVTALEKQAKTLLMFLFCILSLPFFYVQFVLVSFSLGSDL